MTPRIQKHLRQAPSPEPLRVTNRHAAGIDIHTQVHWVAVPPEDAPPPPRDQPADLPKHVRRFGTCTADLMALADWLTQCGVKTIALESTGIYWVPLFELLESRGFEVYLVDPRQSRHAPGRPKSDVLDCQWLQRLHTFGLLRPSFRPPESVLTLRGYWRQRQMLVRYAASHVQHVQKALEQIVLRVAGGADLERADLLQAGNERCGVGVAAGMRAVLAAHAGRRIAAQRHDVANAGIPVGPRDLIDLAKVNLKR